MTPEDIDGTMSVRQFGRAILAALAIGGAVGGFVGYKIHDTGAYNEGAKAEERAMLEMLASNEPCVAALKICYPELKSATSYVKQGFFKPKVTP